MPEPTTVSRGLLARLFHGADGASLSVVGDALVISGAAQAREIPVSAMNAVPLVESGRVWASLIIQTDARIEAFRGFPKATLLLVAESINASLSTQARSRFAYLDASLADVSQEAEAVLSGTEYVRIRRRQALLHVAAESISIRENSVWRQYATGLQRVAVARITMFMETAGNAIDRANKSFVEGQLLTFKPLFDIIESKPLTDAQRLACVVSEENNLVLAGAGTGKTSTMIGRAGYLVASGQARADQILMLAYAKKAAGEMQERQESRLGPWLKDGVPTIKTFHALGLEIIGKAEGRRPDITPLAEDAHRFAQFIDDCIASQCEEPEYRSMMIRYCGSERFPYRNPFDFKSMEEYLTYVRENELRTLKGEIVKSFEEVVIANLLNAQGVTYEYERAYEVDTADPDYRQYRPDFYLPDSGVYLEHFALDRAGQPPEYFDRQRYLMGVAWKRELHKMNGTHLIETYSYMKREDILESSLTEMLIELGVEFAPRSEAEMLEELRESSEVANFAALVSDFIGLFKQSDLEMAEVRALAVSGRDPARLALLLDLIDPVLGTYEADLAEHSQIDFADMIARATAHVESGRYASPYTHILVDEFQDISQARAKLVQALCAQRPETILFAVGDDWQSIYRFTGSNIGYTSHFAAVFGRTVTNALDMTFRFNSKLGDVASQFVRQNPEQLKKSIVSLWQADKAAVSLVRSLSTQAGLVAALDAIAELSRYGTARETTVLVMGRFNFVVEEWQTPEARTHLREDYPSLTVDFTTVHAAKGKEADYVIVLGLSKGKYGFPSSKPTNAALELLLPPREEFPLAEERRLFYVALTRARHRVYLVYNPMEVSPFIIELLDQEHPYAVCTDEFDAALLCAEMPIVPCPKCGDGTLVPRESAHGVFVGCSNYPYCKHTEKPCPACGGLMRRVGQERRCANAACGAVVPLCVKCGADMVERTGPYGRFFGCTNYRANRSGSVCTHTMQIAEEARR